MTPDDYAMRAYCVQPATPEELRSCRAEWNRLVDEMAFPTPFATWEWATTWQEHFGTGSIPWVLFVQREGCLVGILPLANTKQRGLLGFLGGSITELIGAAQVGADHLDLIVHPTHAAGCAHAINEYLRNSDVRWHELRLSLLSAHGELLSHCGRLGAGLRIDVRAVTIAPYVPITGTFDDFLKTLSSNERYKLRSRTRKLLQAPGVEYCRFGRDERAQALERLFALHRLRYAQKPDTSSFDRPEVEAFHRKLLSVMPWDRVMLRGLRHDSEVFSMFYGFRVARRTFYFQLGYDPAWSATSPGLVLLTQTLQETFDNDCIEYNFLQGDENFKNTWAKHSRPLFDCRVYNMGLEGALAHRAKLAREWVKALRQPKGEAPRLATGSNPPTATQPD